MRKQFSNELSALEDEFYKNMRELEIMYMRTEIKILKEKIIKKDY